MKAILVLDEMPEACGPCRFSERGYQPHCIASGRTHAVDLQRADRPDWCPLKEVPRKRGKMFLTERSQNDTDLMVKSAFANCYTDGWNACIEELEK